jgi:hypothetical protein
VVKEVLSTEIFYNDAIGKLVEVAIAPLKWQCRHSKNTVMTIEEINSIFSNMEQIHDLSTQFIDRLKPRIEGATPYVAIGEDLLFLAPLLTLYVTFCNRFETARAQLEIAEKRALFRDWRSKCYDPLGYPTMGSLLIQPIQRIPRYVMLLHEMVKSTWEEHPDYANLLKAQEMMKQVAIDVNAKMGNDEDDDEMMTAQGHFGAFVEILSPSREFVRQSELCVQRKYHKAGAAEDMMHVFLFNDLLVVADKIGDTYEYDGHVPLQWGKSTVQTMPDMKHLKYMVRLCSSQRCYVFSCASRKEQAALAAELGESIAKNQESGDRKEEAVVGDHNMTYNVAEAPTVMIKGTMVREDHNGKKYTTYVLELSQDHTEGGGGGGARASTSSSASGIWGQGASAVLNRLFKRYGEFVELEAALRKEFTGAIYGSGGLLKSCNVAMLPPAKLFSSNPREVELRMVMVGLFVQHVMLIPAITESNLLMNFLEEHIMGWDDDCESGAEEGGEEGDDSDEDEDEGGDAFNLGSMQFGDTGVTGSATAGAPSAKAKRTSVMSLTVVGGGGGRGSRGSSRGRESNASTSSRRTSRRPTTRLTVKAGRNSILLPAQELVEIRFWHGEPMMLEVNTHMRTPEVLQFVGEQLGIVAGGSGQLQLGTCGLYLCGSAKDASSTDYAQVMGYQLGDTEPSHCLDKAEFPLRALQEKRIRDQRAHLLFQKRLFLRADKYWMASIPSMPAVGGASGVLAPPDSPGLQQQLSVNGSVSAAVGRLLHSQCYAQIILGCWACDLADATTLAALHAQSELGDYSDAKQEKFEDQHDFIPAPYLGNGANGSGSGGNPAKASTAPSLAGSVDLPLYSLVRDPKYKDKSNVFKLKSSDGSLEWRHDYLLHSDSQLDFTEWMQAISQDVSIEGEDGEAIVKLNEVAAKASARGGVIDEDEMEDGSAAMKTTTNKEAAEKRMKIAMDLVTGSSMPSKQGWLNKKGHKRRNWNRRWFVLIDKQLLYFKSKPDMSLDRAFWKRELRMKWSEFSYGTESMGANGSRGSADIGGALLGGVDGGASARRMYVERVMSGVPAYGLTIFAARFDAPAADDQAAVSSMVAVSYGGGGGSSGSFGAFSGAGKKEPARKSSFPLNMGLGKAKRKTELQSFTSSTGMGGMPSNVLLSVNEDGLSVLADSVLEASRTRVRNGAAVLDKEALIALSAEPVICFRYNQMVGLSDFHGELQITVDRNSGNPDGEAEEVHFGFKTEEAHEICLLMQEYMEASKHSEKAVRSSQTEESLGMYKAKRFSARKSKARSSRAPA